jgi:hypothetical protein
MTPSGSEVVQALATTTTATTTEHMMDSSVESAMMGELAALGLLEDQSGDTTGLVTPNSASGTATPVPPLAPDDTAALGDGQQAHEPIIVAGSPDVAAENDGLDRLADVESPEPLPIPPILNDRLAALAFTESNSNRTFTCFQNLPTELRLQIWRHGLQQPRQIRIRNPRRRYTEPMGSNGVNKAYKFKNTLGNLVSCVVYSLNPGVGDAWESRRFPSALMAVNVEARQAAMEFYYIQIPAVSRSKHQDAGPTIYLNPDWDYVRFFTKAPTDMLDFLWDMRAYDPKGRGIKHWVVGYYDLFTLTRRNPMSLAGITAHPSPFFFDGLANPLKVWPCPDRAVMGSLLANLETVMLAHRDLDKSRLSRFEQSQFDSLKERHELLPVNARPHAFDILDSDPRAGLSDAMTTLWVKESPLEARAAFESLLSYFGMTPGPQTEICHMISICPVWRRDSDGSEENWVSDREDFVDLLRSDAAAATDTEADGMEDDLSLGASELPTVAGLAGTYDPELDDVTEEVRESNERMGLPPVEVPDAPAVERVAGFWLFSTEDFGEQKERSGDMTRWNVSKARPRLGVYRLPSTAQVK